MSLWCNSTLVFNNPPFSVLFVKYYITFYMSDIELYSRMPQVAKGAALYKFM